ncbi:MAG: hypothetical protein EXR50_07025 [Dehalococcoidia bacterium]|nr:hypothetical protein [Dehalococcoidia bacterium]
MLTFFPNGFLYGLRFPPAPSDPAVAERNLHAEELAPFIKQIWQKTYLPHIATICRQMQKDDYRSMSVMELASHLETCVDRAAHAFGLTQIAAIPMFQCSRALVAFCQQEFGPDGEAMAGEMMEGIVNESSSSHSALWELAQFANSMPAVARIFRSHNRDEIPALLPDVVGGNEFMMALGRFLDRYGWRPEIWFELSLPTWGEDPRPALALMQSYLRGEESDPRNALARSARRRQKTTALARSRFKNNSGKLKDFNSLLASARQYVPVREGRALQQLTVGGSLRVPCKTMGQTLVESGVISQWDDIFYLRLGEIQEIGRGGNVTTWQAVVDARRAERAHWMTVTPPATIGASPISTGAQLAGPTGGATTHTAEAKGQEQVLLGNPASRGVAQGRAKVVRTLDEAEKVKHGDVLVCRTTSPAWTYLFPRVAAIVTEGGGVLSHSAIVAREYAIPCVVGVQGATERIKDFMLISVDGTQGIVRMDEVASS